MTAARASRGRIWLALAAVYVIWGSTYLAIRYAIETLPPFLMAGVRFLIAGTILYLWARARGAARPDWRNWRAATIVGALLLLCGNGGVVWAEKSVPSGLAALLVAIVPLWMVSIEALRPGGDRPGLRTWLGIGLGLAGVVLLVGGGSGGGGGLAGGETYLWGMLALLGASLAWSYGSIWSKTAPLPSSPLLATGMEMLCGGALLLVAGLLMGEGGIAWQAGWQAMSAKSLWAMAYLIVFGSLIGFTAYIWLLAATSPALASTYAFVNPVVAVFLGWAFAEEPVTARTLIAAAVIVAGVLVITLGRAHERRVAREESEPAGANGLPRVASSEG